MTKRGGRAVGLAGAAVVLAGSAVFVQATAQAGEAPKKDSPGSSASATEAADARDRSSKFDDVVTLDDGRRVGMYYDEGRGLVEQHYSPESKKWSTPHLIYKTATDPCQSLKLKAFGGTVAAIADFGQYCSDGEPPTESIAAASYRFATWDTKLTRDFDGWEKVSGSGDGRLLTFSRTSTETITQLNWDEMEGFGEVQTRPRTGSD
ncbi:hypothetical protein ACTWQF_29125 [Streptomyces sp. 8N114]|uniref:hypothetical protein n=1 Tax=Streptomyces sp. 8N114 TaxID=3457419 RepID=UPI003FD108BC